MVVVVAISKICFSSLAMAVVISATLVTCLVVVLLVLVLVAVVMAVHLVVVVATVVRHGVVVIVDHSQVVVRVISGIARVIHTIRIKASRMITVLAVVVDEIVDALTDVRGPMMMRM